MARKHRLDDALIGINNAYDVKEEEEELVELAGVDHTKIGKQLNQVADGCSAYFEHVSKTVDHTQNTYLKNIIVKVQSLKNIFLLRQKDEYTALKLSAFDVLDAARDVQLKVESAQYRIKGEPAKINRYIGKKPMWYYQHRFAKNLPNNCEYDRKIVAEHI